MYNGTATHFAQGAFVKGGDSQAIYLVWNQALHVFSTWDEYRRCGGATDLSNVNMVLTVPSTLIGLAVPYHFC